MELTSGKTYFAEVILPLFLRGTYTYRVPKGFEAHLKIGQRVVVQFGKRKVYTSIVTEIHDRPPKEYVAKYLMDILDREPIVLPYQLDFWKWMSAYYMCSLGEVMNAALPGGLKLSSESKISARPDFESRDPLDLREQQVMDALQVQSELTADQVATLIGLKSPYAVLRSLIDKGAVLLVEELKKKVKPKIERYILLSQEYHAEAAMQDLFDQLERRAPKQVAVMMKYLEMSRFYSDAPVPVKRRTLERQSGTSAATVKALVTKGVLIEVQQEVGRLQDIQQDPDSDLTLSTAQLKAYQGVKNGLEKGKVTLLQGVTSSGKTEIYIQLITDALAQGQQVLYLVPEIALTTQLIQRLQRYFGEKVGIYHSRFSESERVEVWKDLFEKKHHDHRIVIGARSALFTPLADLGLVIVDEEHDSSFKQYDPAPRYNARDAAVVLGHMRKAKVVLGSATPSAESVQNAFEGKYHHVQLAERYGGIRLPEILVADLTREYKRKTMQSHFSSLLLDHMKEALKDGRQIILFQNRRGYNPLWQCEDDAWTPQCVNCDVSLTYHRGPHRLRCHYCGYSIEPPTVCQACGSQKLKMLGFGTEKVEDELRQLLPEAKIDRMDLDTTRKKNAYAEIISRFEERSIDILVGTQMVTKGLDFANVGLVGVLSADAMLNRPDFRAFERAYQMMTQVAGRAGRDSNAERGKVVIQTHQPDHWVIQNVITNDYERLMDQDLLERRNFSYPPFSKMIRITMRHKSQELLDHSAGQLADLFRQRYGSRILGPEYPYVARVKNLYQKEMILKFERSAGIGLIKKDLRNIIDQHQVDKDNRSVRVVIDVDPQ